MPVMASSSGVVKHSGIHPAPATSRPRPPSSRTAVVAAAFHRRSVASHQAPPPVAWAVSRAAVQRTTRLIIATEPVKLTTPRADTSRSISAASVAEAPSSRQRQASMSRNSRDRQSTNRAGSVSPVASSGCAARACPTSRSSRLPAEPPARFVRAIQASAQVAASHDSQRSTGEAARAASSRHSPIAPSTNAIRWASPPPLRTCAASFRRRLRPSSVSPTSASCLIHRAAFRAETAIGSATGLCGRDGLPVGAAASFTGDTSPPLASAGGFRFVFLDLAFRWPSLVATMLLQFFLVDAGVRATPKSGIVSEPEGPIHRPRSLR